MFHSKADYWPYPQTLDLAGNACQGKHSSLLQKSVNYTLKSFIVQAPGVGLIHILAIHLLIIFCIYNLFIDATIQIAVKCPTFQSE